MIFFILLSTTTFSIGLCQPKESDENLWLKLRKYQNMTGISEDTMQSIWEQSAALETGQKLTRRRRTTQQGTYFIQLNINLNKKLNHKVECRNFELERTSDYLER